MTESQQLSKTYVDGVMSTIVNNQMMLTQVGLLASLDPDGLLEAVKESEEVRNILACYATIMLHCVNLTMDLEKRYDDLTKEEN